MSSEEIRLLDCERKVGNNYLLEMYPGHYTEHQGHLLRWAGPRLAKEVLTDGELVGELEEALLQMESRSERLAGLLEGISLGRRECEFCGELFRPHRSDQRFCPGGKCGNAYHSQRHREKRGPVLSVPIKCPECKAIQEGSAFLGVDNKIVTTCVKCEYEAPLLEFRRGMPGYGSIK